jgi:proton-translocating NADH-quinone oxidoreductase chain L
LSPAIDAANLTISALEGAAQNAWLVPVLPLCACLTISLVTRRWGSLSALVAILAQCGTLGLAISIFLQRLHAPEALAMGWSRPWITVGGSEGFSLNVGLLVDNLSSLMLAMVCFIALLIQIYSYSYMKTEIGHFPTQGSASMSRFFAYLSLFVFSMLGLVLSDNLVMIYMFWELVGLCSYFLIGFWYFKSSAAQASKKAFVVTKFADLGFLVGILLVGGGAGTFSFTELAANAHNLVGMHLAIGLALIFCGAIGKSAQFPLQIWLPDAMEGPTPVSALIHAATMVAAGVYLVARLFPLFYAAPAAGEVVAVIGATTAFLAASIAIVQNDIKRVLAYSTVSQLGYMMAGLGCGALTAGTFHLITHAFFKSLLFLGSGAVIVACHSNDMWTMGGLHKHMKATHFAFLCGCLALSGFPGFSGFFSKDEILLGVSGHPFILITLTLAAFMTAFYVTRMYCLTFLGDFRGAENAGPYAGPVPPLDLAQPMHPSHDVFHIQPHWTEERVTQEGSNFPAPCLGALSEHGPEGHHVPHEVGPMMVFPLLILSIFAIGLGWLQLPGSEMFGRFIHATEQTENAFNPLLMGVSILMALAGIGCGWGLYAKNPVAGEARLRGWFGRGWVFLQQKWYMDHIWAWLLANFLYRDALVIADFDDKFVDRAVLAVGQLTEMGGDRLRAEQSGLVQRYALQIVMATMVLLLTVGILQFVWVRGLQWF